MYRSGYLCIVVVCLWLAACSADRRSESVLSNGNFESGNLDEMANDALGDHPWLTSNRGDNTIAASSERAFSGQGSLKWAPIGWNAKEDGNQEDASAFIVTKIKRDEQTDIDLVRVSGAVDTSDLDARFALRVTLANSVFTRWNVETVIQGGEKGWQEFEAQMPLKKADQSVFLAFTVLGTRGVGASDCAVYLDDLNLSFSGTPKSPLALAEAVDIGPAPEGPRSFRMGFTPFPWDMSIQALEETYSAINAEGDIIGHHLDDGVPWPEALAEAPFSKHLIDDWDRRKANTPPGTPVFLALTCLNSGRDGAALYHGEKENMPLPEEFRDLKFDDPKLTRAYVNYCLRAVEHFKPSYLAIGIEVNELLEKAPGKWPGFDALYRQTRAALKRKYPDLPVFATVTLHGMFYVGRDDPDAPQVKAIRNLMPKMDLLGLSFYSFIRTVGDPTRPTDALEWIREFADGKPIAVCETGFPAEPTPMRQLKLNLPGSLKGQAAYWRLLLETANKDHYQFVISFLYRDYDALWERIAETAPDSSAAWRDCGLADGDGSSRPALEIWRRYRVLPLSEPPLE